MLFTTLPGYTSFLGLLFCAFSGKSLSTFSEPWSFIVISVCVLEPPTRVYGDALEFYVFGAELDFSLSLSCEITDYLGLSLSFFSVEVGFELGSIGSFDVVLVLAGAGLVELLGLLTD